MADFPTALQEALQRHYSVREDYRSPVESRRGLTARMDALKRAYKSDRAAARAAGIAPDTWSRWRHGKQAPGAGSLAKVAAAHLALLRAAKVARKGYPTSFGITAVVAAHPKASLGRQPKASTYYNGGSYSSSQAHRQFNTYKLTTEQYRAVVNTWAAGSSPQDVADALTREIERAYPGVFEFEGNQVTVEIRG